MLQSGLDAIFTGENRGVVAHRRFGFHKLVCMRVVISLVFLLCFQNDCMKAPVGDSDPILILGVRFQRLCFVVSCFSLVCG